MSYQQFVKQMSEHFKLLLIGVMNSDKKKLFIEQFEYAIREQNRTKMLEITSDVLEYTKISFKKEKKYDKPPTFDVALVDILIQLCIDISSIPDLPEMLAEPDIICKPGGWGGGGGGGKKKSDKRIANKINTIVKKGMIIASAACQSGKTMFTICSAIKGMAIGNSAIIVVRNLYGDANQMSSNLLKVAGIIEAYFIKHSVDGRRFAVSVIDGNDLTKPLIRQQVKDSFNGGYPRIILCLGNRTQLGNVNEIAKETSGSFSLYIDEIDKVDYGKTKDTESASDILKELKNQAYQVIGVTATPLDCIFSEVELKSANQIRLSHPANYRGFSHIQIKPLIIDSDISSLDRVTDYDGLCKADANLSPFLEEFSTSLPDFSWIDKVYIPNTCLIKITRFVDSQINLFKGINKHFNGKFATVVCNGKGVCMYHPDLPLTFTVAGVSVKRGEFFNGNIADVLQYFKDNGNVDKFPRIIMIAGELAGRCISYVTRDYVWHLTDMYYNPAKSTPIPEMTHSAGRLCGLNMYKSHLRLHTPMFVATALWNGLNFTNEVINRAIASPLLDAAGEEKSFADSIKNIPMLKTKLPEKRDLTNKVKVNKRDFNLVSKNDGGESLESYKFELVEEPVAKVAKVDTPDVTQVATPVATPMVESVAKELPEEEFVRLTTVMFPKWSKADTKIAKFMQNLDPRKVYTERDMKNLCKETGIQMLNQLLTINVGSNGFGTIIKKINNKYQLYTELVSSFDKYF